MSKKPLPISERKVKLSITIDKALNKIIEAKINNKSKYIEELIKKDLLK
jgi:hypothetical protein